MSEKMGSEKIYALLFHLFPARFRAAWQDEALELFRDRLAHERGLHARLRLWFDLASDFALSLPRVYLSGTAALAPAPQPGAAGVPTFRPLETPPVRSSAYFFGTILSALAIVVVSILLKHGGHFPAMQGPAAAEGRGFTADPWATGAGGGGNGSGTAIGKPPSAFVAQSSGLVGPTNIVSIGKPKPNYLFDYAQRQVVLDGIIQNLHDHYPNPDVANSAARSLRIQNGLGRFRSATEPAAFAALVTSRLRESTHDMHLEVVFSERELFAGDAGPSPEEEAQYRSAMLASNCTFQPVRTLPGNIGYLKFNTFPDPGLCASIAAETMDALNSSSAVILDLRDNSGGSPQMVMFLAAYFFDRPAFFWNPREDNQARMWTRSPVSRSRLTSKPLFVLTSSRTWSAAEHFTYNMKMLYRAVIVGETTGGATDVGVFHRVDAHFGIGISETHVRNPYSTPDWAATGVAPDVSVPAGQALETAQRRAARLLANQ
jgi:hypothetical protein